MGRPRSTKPRLTHAERFLSRIPISDPDDCWHWQGTIMISGYGAFCANGKKLLAHRLNYERAHGPIPDGLLVGHVCHDRDLTCPGGPSCFHRRCVNPSHLEAMTMQQNIRGGRARAAVNARRTQCVHGHAFDEVNTQFRPDGRRACRACHRARGRERYAKRKKEALGLWSADRIGSAA